MRTKVCQHPASGRGADNGAVLALRTPNNNKRVQPCSIDDGPNGLAEAVLLAVTANGGLALNVLWVMRHHLPHINPSIRVDQLASTVVSLAADHHQPNTSRHVANKKQGERL